MRQVKCYDALRMFDIDKAKNGEPICWRDGSESVISFVSESNVKNSVCCVSSNGKIIHPLRDDLRMQPLFWLEGKPVYKGDELWHTSEGLEHYNYIVETYNKELDLVCSEDHTVGWEEHSSLLSWNRQTDKAEEKIPDVIHDVTAFKVGDKVKVVRVLPCKNYKESGWNNSWIEEMNSFVNHIRTIGYVSTQGVYVDAWFGFPSCVLELVEPAKETKVKILEVYLDGKLIKREEIKFP